MHVVALLPRAYYGPALRKGVQEDPVASKLVVFPHSTRSIFRFSIRIDSPLVVNAQEVQTQDTRLLL